MSQTWVCPNECNPPAVKVVVDYSHDPEQIGILVHSRTGKPTGLWGNGTPGVPDEVQALAEVVHRATCPICLDDCYLEGN